VKLEYSGEKGVFSVETSKDVQFDGDTVFEFAEPSDISFNLLLIKSSDNDFLFGVECLFHAKLFDYMN
jgi:hypothetical protein